MVTGSKERLNQRLFEICTAVPVDYEAAEVLLKKGAEPLGKVIDKHGKAVNLYTEIIDVIFDHKETRKDFYLVTALFLRYGMDVSKPAVPYESSKSPLHPLWYFSLYSNETVFQTLKLFLDNGLSPKDAASCWDESLFMFSLVIFLEDPLHYEILYDYCKKVMLIASYPNILQNDKDLRKAIWYDLNDYDMMKFRQWDAFTYEVDTSHCLLYPEINRSVVTIIEKESGQPVWRFGIGISPDEIEQEKKQIG